MAVRVSSLNSTSLTSGDSSVRVSSLQLLARFSYKSEVRLTKVNAHVRYADKTFNVRVSTMLGYALVSLDQTIQAGFAESNAEAFDPGPFVESSYEIIEPDRPQREPNPYKPITPREVESVDSTLYSYLSEMQETLRKQHNLTQMGDTTYSWERMTESTPEQLHNLGSIGRFYHDDYGVVICRYVQFQRMRPKILGHGPVGRLRVSTTVDWIVTNDIDRSSPYLAVGMMPQYDSPLDGSYGWVIVCGANITSIITTSPPNRQEAGLSWTGFERIGFGGGKVLGRMWTRNDGGRINPGELFINVENWSQYDIQALIDGTVDPLIERLDELEELVHTIQGQIGFVDFGPIQSQIDSLRADLNQEAQRRSKADAQILAKIGDPSNNVTQLEFTAFQSSIIERIDYIESSFDARINNAQARADAAYLLAQANSTTGIQEQLDNINTQISQMLSALDDFAVDYSNPPQDGDYLVYSSTTGRFVPLPPFSGAPVPGSPHGPHRYWRVLVLGQSTDATIAELQFLPKSGDAPLAGTPVFSDESGGASANAFDGDPSTIWQANAQLAWIGLDLGSGNDSEVGQVVVQAPSAGAVTGLPQEIQIEYSDDGSTWELGWSFLGEAAWTNDEFRRYDDPNWNRGSLPSSIGWLGDVDVDTNPPTDQQSLVFDSASGKWIPGAAVGTTLKRAMLTYSTTQSILDNTNTELDWDTEIVDEGDWFDSGNPTRLTVPAGVSQVRVMGAAVFAANSTGIRQVFIRKNGANFVGRPGASYNASAAGNYTSFVSSGILDVTPGDYFEMRVLQNSGGALNILGTDSSHWFAIEEVSASAGGGGGGGGSGVDVEDEGTPVATATTINFVGSGVTATDSGSGVVEVDIPGGGGGGGGLKPCPDYSTFFPIALNSPTGFSSEDGYGIFVDCPGGSPEILRGYVKSIAAGAFTVTMQASSFNSGNNFNAIGMILWDSSASQGYDLLLYSNASIASSKWTSLTAQSSDLTILNAADIGFGLPRWLQARRDGADSLTLYWGWTKNGPWILGRTVSSMGGINQVGIGVCLRNANNNRGLIRSFDDGTDSFYLDPGAVTDY